MNSLTEQDLQTLFDKFQEFNIEEGDINIIKIDDSDNNLENLNKRENNNTTDLNNKKNNKITIDNNVAEKIINKKILIINYIKNDNNDNLKTELVQLKDKDLNINL